MEEEARDEEVAAIVGALSAIHMQLQEVEETAMERARIFRNGAEQSTSSTSDQFNTGWHVLREISADVQEIQEHIDGLVEFMRTGTLTKARSRDMPAPKEAARPDQIRFALQNAAASFKKASNALYIVGRALEAEDLDLYADHLYNLSESVEAEANRARSALESEERELESKEREDNTGSFQPVDGRS